MEASGQLTVPQKTHTRPIAAAKPAGRPSSGPTTQPKVAPTKKQGEHFPDLILRLGGKPALSLFTGWTFLYAAFVLRSGADRLVGTVYPGASPALFSQLMGLIALLAALSTPRTLARIGRMLLPILYGVLGLLLFFAFTSVDLGNLLPVGVSDVWPVLKATPMPLDILAGTGTALCFLAGGSSQNSLIS